MKATLKIFLPIIILMSALASLPHYSQAAAITHPAGTLIQNSSSYWIINDKLTARIAIDSEDKLNSNRLSTYNAVPANSADLALPVAETMAWGDGVLFSDHSIIYQVSGGKKHGFISAEVYLGQGFKFEMVKPGNLSSLPEGTPVRSAKERHLPGTLISSPNGTVYLQNTTSSSPFPSAGVFFSYGGKFSDVAPANATDSFADAPLNFRTGAIVNDNGAIWVIAPTGKLGFPSASCFLNFGYTFTAAFNGSTSGIASKGTVCGEGGTVNTGAVSAYSTPTVATAQGNFAVRMAAFNLSSGKVRVITDTAADQDCTNNCPVASLQDYLRVNGGQAAMNGTYFCPTAYADCAGKTNTFFWKVLDTGINKIINAGNGLGDEDPFITFDSTGQPKYFAHYKDYASSGFKAAAGINSASLIADGKINVNTAKLDDKQRTTKSTQGALAVKGQMLYLIHVFNATVPDEAAVLQSLGMDYAILLDGGGSAGMMFDGSYKTGPGRSIPNAVVVKVLP
jgi:Phosphodiester glycosidase